MLAVINKYSGMVVINGQRKAKGELEEESKEEGFPGSSVVKEFTCQCRRHRFNPWSGKILHALEQLNLCTTMAEPVLQSPETATIEPVCRTY